MTRSSFAFAFVPLRGRVGCACHWGSISAAHVPTPCSFTNPFTAEAHRVHVGPDAGGWLELPSVQVQTLVAPTSTDFHNGGHANYLHPKQHTVFPDYRD